MLSDERWAAYAKGIGIEGIIMKTKQTFIRHGLLVLGSVAFLCVGTRQARAHDDHDGILGQSPSNTTTTNTTIITGATGMSGAAFVCGLALGGGRGVKAPLRGAP